MAGRRGKRMEHEEGAALPQEAGGLMPPELRPLIEQGLEFTYHIGDVTPLTGITDTGWRILPYLTVSACDAPGTLELEGRILRGTGKPISGGCVPPGLLHRCTTLDGSTGTSWWCCVSYSILGGVDLFTLLEVPLTLDERTGNQVRHLATELAGIQGNAAPSLEQLAQRQSLGFALLAVLARRARWREAGPSGGLAIQRLLPLFSLIQRSLHRRIGIAELARSCGMSLARFHRHFRACTGMPPHAYIARRRLHLAQRLLLTTSMGIAGIAEAVGMQDQFYFSRWFRAGSGLCPSRYRSQLSRWMQGPGAGPA